MARFRFKAMLVDSFIWTGGTDQTEDPEWIIAALKKKFPERGSARIVNRGGNFWLEIVGRRGVMIVDPGQRLCREVDSGHLFRMSDTEFQLRYEPCNLEGDVIADVNACIATEGNSVTILCDNPEAESVDQQSAVEACGDFTDYKPMRFYGSSWMQALSGCALAARCVSEERQCADVTEDAS